MVKIKLSNINLAGAEFQGGQSFHKKGKRIMERATTITSNPIIKNVSCVNAPCLNTSPKADFDNLMSNSNCGMIRGKPSMAISAEFC